MTPLTRKQVNDIIGWIDDFAPRDPERIRQEIERARKELCELCVELKDSARWHAQRDAYNAIAKHALGKRDLTEDEFSAMTTICEKPYQSWEVKP